MKNQEYAGKANTKRNSKSYNDANRSFDGRLARKATNAFKARKAALYESAAY